MSDPNPRPWRAAAAKWVSVIAMAMLTAYSTHPLLTLLLQVVDDTTQHIGASFMTLMMAGLLLVFGGAVLALLRKETPLLRAELGCRWSGMMLWLTIPVMVQIVWLQAMAENGADHGGATAAFFMLMIFGGYCAILGTVLLGVASVLRRKRMAAQSDPLSR